MIPDAPASRADGRGARPRRLDALDGLRAVAVLLVLAYHVSVPGLRGGFLGVDVFFVLSGFLITTLLLRDLAHRGRIDLGHFWMRRVLRLAPASLLVILVVLLWGMTLAPPFQREALGADALWSLLYLGNWRFISTSGYFGDDGMTSPLQHVWSLAVEEQFYVVWPLVLTLAALLALRGTSPARAPVDSAERSERTARRRRRAASTALLVALAGAAVSAWLFAALYAPAAPDRAYMGTDTKAFEPLLGAAAAALMTRPAVRSWVCRRAQALMVVGLLILGVGVILLGDRAAPSPLYFRGGGLAFAVGCAVLVAATSVADRRRGLALVLGSTPMAYVGRISYGIYLWHWPLAVWIVAGHGFSPRRAALVAAATFGCAALSYHLLEVPIRTGRIARSRPRRVLPSAAGAVTAVAVVAALLGGSPLNRVVPPIAARAGGDSTLVLVGDSVMSRLVPALAQAGADRDVGVVNAARGGCPALTIPVLDGRGEPLSRGRCTTQMARLQSNAVEEHRPGIVVWWSRYELADRVGPDGRKLVAGAPGFWEAQEADLDRAIDRLTATGATLVIVEVDRTGAGIDSRCSPTNCDPFLRRLRDDDELRVRWNAILRERAAADPRVRLIRVDDTYCRDEATPCDDRLPIKTATAAGFSPPAGPASARPDGSHFSPEAMPTVAATVLARARAAARG